METKKVSFEEIFDLFAIRIIFEPKPNIPEKAQCWSIYSIITDIYIPRSDRIRDWVSKPKANGYEALHATVMGPGGNWVEVQIRTTRMNEIAEKGYAAHWKYKGTTNQESELDRWIKDEFKLNLFTSEIMVFTPKGEIITLPSGSTALDFAFFIHSQIGLKAIGAKVNHKLVGLNHKLQGGDQIEIITSEKQQPDMQWLKFVSTAKAKARLKTAFREKRRILALKGKVHLENLLFEMEMKPNSTVFRKLYNHYNTRNKEELYYRIGEDTFDQDYFRMILKKRSLNKYVKFWGIGNQENTDAVKMFDKSKPLVVDDNMRNYTIATCCNPIPGDDVIGYKSDEDELEIHKTSCTNAIRYNSSESQNVVKVEWTTQKILAFLGRISLKGIDDIGIVNECTTVISKELNVNMRAINFESHDGIFEGIIDVYVRNANDLNTLIMNLSRVRGITHTARLEIKE
jgi:guanosine-3',5'-bis(diphosphate) 3'-pyrophosphohydrolase